MFDFEQYQQLLKQLNIGKALPDAIYVHKDALTVQSKVPDELTQVITNIAKALKFDDSDWHVLKFFKKSFKVSYLAYPDFYTDSYPALQKSTCVDLNKLTTKVTNYDVEDQKELIKKLCWYDLLFLIKCTQTQIPENLVSDMKVQILYRLM